MKNNSEIYMSYVPDDVSLYYVDYNDNLDEHEDIQQKCLDVNSLSPLYEKIDDWYGEQEAFYCNEYLEKIKNKMTSDHLEEEYYSREDAIIDLLHDRNDTDPVKGLIRYTRATNMFYSLGVEFDGYRDNGCASYQVGSVAMTCHKIRQVLGLKKGQFDDRIMEIVENANDGGELRIYFNAIFNNLISKNEGEDFKTIRFYGHVQVAIANSHNGSGYNTTIPLNVTLPFKRENLFIDSQVHYAYASEVCGMCHDWCESTSFELGMNPIRKSINKSLMTEHLSKEASYSKIFKAGGCSFGDMDITRHRNVYYDNNFPCGNYCPHCKTFWID